MINISNSLNAALSFSGAYMVYSGIQGAFNKKGTPKKLFEISKVFFGITLLANQLGFNPFSIETAEKVVVEKLYPLTSDKFDPTSCYESLNMANPPPELFETLDKTQGLSCENHLPWKDAFHRGGTGYIDGIHPKDMDQPVMWGVDPWQRFFVAVKHTCDKVTEGAGIFFQRYSDEQLVMSSGHFQDTNCMPGVTSMTDRSDYYDWLKELFTKGFSKLPYCDTTHLA